MISITLSKTQLETLFKCIGSRMKNITESHKNNTKNGRTNCVERNIENLRACDNLRKEIDYQIIDSVGFFEKE